MEDLSVIGHIVTIDAGPDLDQTIPLREERPLC